MVGFREMKKAIAIIVLGLLLSSNAYAVPHWLGPAFELCIVNQEIIFYHYSKDEEKKNTWKSEGVINLLKGDYLSVHKSKGGRKFFASSSAAFPSKSDDYDRISISNKYEGLKLTDVVDCQKYKTKTKKIKYSTYDVFTQEDLFNGLEDNKKLKGNGNLEFPGYKKCKGIKKFPFDFWVIIEFQRISP